MKKRIACLLFMLLFLLGTVACADEEQTYALEIRVLDVGQGDAILLRTAEGDILIDAGPEDSQEALCFRLAELGVEQLRLAVFTHTDEDHIGGADGVLKSIPTETVWISRYYGSNEATEMLFDAARSTHAQIILVEAGETMTVGEAFLCLLSPFDGFPANSESNEKGLVISMTCGAVRALFAGDISEKTETMLLQRYPNAQLSCQLLKVAHHGSETSSSVAFLEAASPDYAVISCGKGNLYGHPHGVVLDRLQAVGAEILRTDLLGELVFYSDGDMLIRAEAD